MYKNSKASEKKKPIVKNIYKTYSDI